MPSPRPFRRLFLCLLAALHVAQAEAVAVSGVDHVSYAGAGVFAGHDIDIAAQRIDIASLAYVNGNGQLQSSSELSAGHDLNLVGPQSISNVASLLKAGNDINLVTRRFVQSDSTGFQDYGDEGAYGYIYHARDQAGHEIRLYETADGGYALLENSVGEPVTSYVIRAPKPKDDGFGLEAMIVGFAISFMVTDFVSAGLAAGEAGGSAWAAGGWANVAVSRAAGTLVSDMATQLIANGRIDTGSLLEDVFSSALINGIESYPFFDGGNSLNSLANLKNFGGAVLAGDGAFDFTSSLAGIAGRSLVSAAIDSAIKGTSFDTGFRTALIGDLSVVGANAIGNEWGAGTWQNILAHGALGCAAAAGAGKDCASGAFGEALSAFDMPYLDRMTGIADPELRRVLLTSLSMAVSGSVTKALGGDPIVAAQVAQNEALNNYLNPHQITLKTAQLAAAKTDEERKQINAYWDQIDAEQKVAARTCLLDGKCASVTDPLVLKGVLNDLQAACDVPRICTADQMQSIGELSALFAIRENAITPDYSLETFLVEVTAIGKGLRALGATVDSLFGGTVAADGAEVAWDTNRAAHIFRDAVGHVNPTTASSQGRFISLFEQVASDSANLNLNVVKSPEAVKAGVQGFAKVFRNGEQVWVQVRNGKIMDAGVNLPGALR